MAPKSVQESSATRGRVPVGSTSASGAYAPSPEPADQIQQLKDLVNTLSEKISVLETQRLEDRMSSPVGSGQSLSGSMERIKVALPDKFDGNCLNFDTFKSALDNYFSLKSTVYSTDEIKVRTIGTLLSKQALQWFGTLVKTNSPLLKDFLAFMDEFKRLFSDPNSKMKSQMLLKKLKQGNGSVLSYYTKFRAISINTGFDVEAQIDAFRSGLSDEIKDVLASSLYEFNDLETLVSLVIKIDTRLFDRKMEKEFKTKTNHLASASGKDNLASIQLINGKISHDERQRRMKFKLCLYCGQAGHNLKGCPKKQNGPTDKKSVSPSAAAIASDPPGSQQ